jgi:hypothetical protein
MLVVMAYGYLASAFVGMAITRLRHRGGRGVEALAVAAPPGPIDRDSAAR